MSEWKEYRFSEFVDINPSVKLTGRDKYSFVEMKDLQNGNKFCIPDSERIFSSGTKFQDGDTLFARITPCLENGKICQVKRLKDRIGFGSTEFLVFRGKKGISDNDFVFYLARWNEVRDFAENHFEGTSGRQRVPKNCFENLYLKLPEYKEQTAIVSTLSSLDDKIDLLHRHNKTLEAMAETLFRQWFVEEAEESWVVGRLGDILESIESGSRPKGGIDPELKTGIPSIGAESINGLGFYDYSKTKYITEEFYKNMKRGLIKNYDVLIYKDGAYIGRKGMFANGFPFERCVVNEHVFILRSNLKSNQIYLYFMLQQSELEQLNANSAQPGLNQESIKSLEIILHSKEKIDKFEQVTKGWIDKIFINCNQIRTLTQLRDTLLPKLMSGEVRVKLD